MQYIYFIKILETHLLLLGFTCNENNLFFIHLVLCNSLILLYNKIKTFYPCGCSKIPAYNNLTVHSNLLSVLISLLDTAVRCKNNSNALVNALSSLEYMFKFIVKSRQLFIGLLLYNVAKCCFMCIPLLGKSMHYIISLFFIS